MNAFQHKLEAQRTPRRAARLIACLVIGLVLPGQISSLFGQHITTIIHDVSAMADGSIAHARLEAQRQETSPTEATEKRVPVRFLENTPRRNFPRR
jgi:hypothetical protein